MTSLSGLSLHSGSPSTVRAVLRDDDGLGIRFHVPGFPEPLDARNLGSMLRSARRATILTHPETGAVWRTPEHLLAASLFFAAAPLDVHCDTDEPPGLDGSARAWFTALAMAAPASAPHAEYAAGGWMHDGPEGFLRALPAEKFSVESVIERGAFRDSFRLETFGAAPAEVLPARTFIFLRDWASLKRHASAATDGSALLGGTGEESGLLLAESPHEFAQARKEYPTLSGNAFPLLHPAAMRFPHEPARHKILDLLGDLALNGLALPKLRLEIRNGGHALNHLLLERLHHERSHP